MAAATVVAAPAFAGASPARPALTHQSPAKVLSKLTARQILHLAAHPDDRVIVLLRHQELSTGGRFSSLTARREQFAGDEAPLVSELSAVHADDVHSYGLINAVSATVSRAEAKRLRRSSEVRAVLPDERITLPTQSAVTPATTSPKGPTIENTEPGTSTGQQVCGSALSPLVEPEGRSLVNADSGDAASVTGSGVKVAVFPDGIDPNAADIPDFDRAGSSVVGDYKDFTGEGTSAVTAGGEAFGDVSSIAAQGNETYDLSKEVSQELPLTSPCDIKIEGVATGATVDVDKVFGDSDASYDSVLLQAIDYAVETQKVNILSESFGGNSVPQPKNDPISLANAAAEKAGDLVVISSGDSGTSDTIGSPASSSAAGILSVGATTSFRAAAQTGIYATPSSENGWENNNVASLSSSGTTEYGPSTVDLVAPGDSGWADCSADTKTYTDCAEEFDPADKSTAPPIQLFGGTSESCPLTAGTAALVIQAYKATHTGAAPAPALIKEILTSTATPLVGVPADEQGSGLVNASAAVAMAESASGGTGAQTEGVIANTNRISAVGAPNGRPKESITLTNPGATAETVTPTLEHLGSAANAVAPTTFTYTGAGDPIYPSPATGDQRAYATKTFTVPSGASRLVVRAAWNDGNSKVLEFALFDPEGKVVNATDPQGQAGFGEVEAASPEAGTWKVVFYPSSTGYDGPINWTAFTQSLVKQTLGDVTVAPGKSATVGFTAALPSSAGDADSSLDLATTDDGGSTYADSQIAVLTRARIPVTKSHAGSFSGILTGGNGRSFFYSQELPYEFTVPAGTKAINVNVKIGAAGREVYGFLGDPAGQMVDAQGTDYFNQDGKGSASFKTFHLSVLSPVKGEWHFDVISVGANHNATTSTSLTGSINFKANTISHSKFPDSKHITLRKNHKITEKVTLVNHGNTQQQFFLDPRLAKRAPMLLQSVGKPSGSLPQSASSSPPLFILPPFANAVAIVENSSRSAYLETFAASPELGDQGYPDVITSSAKQTNTVGLSASDLASTGYACSPALKGPFATSAGSRVAFSCAGAAEVDELNPQVTSTTGDFWGKGRYRPVTLKAGQKRTVTVTIKPTGKKGLKQGFIAVEAFNPVSFSTDVVAKIGYEYRVG